MRLIASLLTTVIASVAVADDHGSAPTQGDGEGTVYHTAVRRQDLEAYVSA